MKKYDIYLAGAIILIALVWFLISTKFYGDGSHVCLYVNNELSGQYDLLEDTEQAVTNDSGREIIKFVIKNETVDVISAQCPDRLCVHQKSISKAGETIVCLPQKIVLKIEDSTGGLNASNENGVDAVTY